MRWDTTRETLDASVVREGMSGWGVKVHGGELVPCGSCMEAQRVRYAEVARGAKDACVVRIFPSEEAKRQHQRENFHNSQGAWDWL